jgi:hypothetical protein
MNSYEAKQEARRERLAARAERLRAEGQRRVDRAHEMASAIPFGQPILVGHHSEGRDRRYRGRIHDNFSKGFETLKAADEVAARAASVGSGGISSDDPDAVDKLRAELVELETRRVLMKDCNAIIRRHKGEAAIPHLVQRGVGQRVAAELIKPDFCGRLGFADYMLTNSGANARRIKARIAELEAKAGAESKEATTARGLRIVENVDANRLQLFFPDRPGPETRDTLKAHGFRWAPSEGAWQRHLSNGARYAAQCVTKVWEVGQ